MNQPHIPISINFYVSNTKKEENGTAHKTSYSKIIKATRKFGSVARILHVANLLKSKLVKVVKKKDFEI